MKRKSVFLSIFILGVILTFNITNIMLKLGFDTTTGIMEATDKRFAYLLVSLFGLTGYFVEIIFEKLDKNEVKNNIN